MYEEYIQYKGKADSCFGSSIRRRNLAAFAPTMQRMIQDYLDARHCRINFSQSDRNACPNCKALTYAILQYSHEAKLASSNLENLQDSPRPFTKETDQEQKLLEELVKTKECQEQESLNEMRKHNERDARIRSYISKLSDYFRNVENSYRAAPVNGMGWKMFSDRGCLTHQDDMSKVDLPHFAVTAVFRYHAMAVRRQCACECCRGRLRSVLPRTRLRREECLCYC